jgi:malate dehydrogenase (NADP+)
MQLCIAVQVEDFELNDWLRRKIDVSAEELAKERTCVGHLIPGSTLAPCTVTQDTMLPGES